MRQENLHLSNVIATAIAGVGYLVNTSIGDRIGCREAAALWLLLGTGAGVIWLSTAGRSSP